jgi:hypothetical protein
MNFEYVTTSNSSNLDSLSQLDEVFHVIFFDTFQYNFLIMNLF